jgi:type IV secretory pathway TrbL component
VGARGGGPVDVRFVDVARVSASSRAPALSLGASAEKSAAHLKNTATRKQVEKKRTKQARKDAETTVRHADQAITIAKNADAKDKKAAAEAAAEATAAEDPLLPVTLRRMRRRKTARARGDMVVLPP